jgi:hypothetical protein
MENQDQTIVGTSIDNRKGGVKFLWVVVLILFFSLISGYIGFYIGLKGDLQSDKVETVDSSKTVDLPEVKDLDWVTQSNWNTYVSDAYGFSFSYPPDWSVEGPSPDSRILELNTQVEIPMESNVDSVIFIISQIDTRGKSLDEWVKDLKSEGFINANIKGESKIGKNTFYEMEGLGAMYETLDYFLLLSNGKYINIFLEPYPSASGDNLVDVRNTYMKVLSTFEISK